MEYFIFAAIGYVISTLADLQKMKELREENVNLCQELAKFKADNGIVDIN